MGDPVLSSHLHRTPRDAVSHGALQLALRHLRTTGVMPRRHSLDSVTRLLPRLRDLRTEVVLLSGGEPLLNVHWSAIAESLRAAGMQVVARNIGFWRSPSTRAEWQNCSNASPFLWMD